MEIELWGYQNDVPYSTGEDSVIFYRHDKPNIIKTGEKGHIITHDLIPEFDIDEFALVVKTYPIRHHPLTPNEQYLYDYGISCQWAIVHSSFDFTNNEYRQPIVKWVYDETQSPLNVEQASMYDDE